MATRTLGTPVPGARSRAASHSSANVITMPTGRARVRLLSAAYRHRQACAQAERFMQISQQEQALLAIHQHLTHSGRQLLLVRMRELIAAQPASQSKRED